MTRPDLDAIRVRCEAAAPGPWVRDKLEIRSFVGGRCQMLIYDEGGHDEQDAEFIANARTDIPALLAYIDGLEREVAELKARIAVLEAMKP